MRMVFNFAPSLIFLFACGTDSGGPTVDFDRNALLAGVDNVVTTALTNSQSKVSTLDSTVDAYCAAIDTADEAAAHEAAQLAWRDAMLAWQHVEVMQIGPLAINDRAVSDTIYSWPLINNCSVDIEVMRYRTDGSFTLDDKLADRRGLDALEYLLFAPDTTSKCETPPAGYEALTDAEKRAARCAFAQLALADTKATLDKATTDWTKPGGFGTQLRTAGQDSSDFSSAQTALNGVSDAMFYIDTEVKDMKLGKPAGVLENQCGDGIVCPEDLESQYAQYGLEAARNNLIAFRRLFRGGDGASAVGFDDYLIALGASELAATMNTDIDAAVAAFEALDEPLETLLQNKPGEVETLYNHVKKITDEFKSQFFTVTGLELPEMGAGDND